MADLLEWLDGSIVRPDQAHDSAGGDKGEKLLEQTALADPGLAANGGDP